MRVLSLAVVVALLDIAVNNKLLVLGSTNGRCDELVSYTKSFMVPYEETYRERKWGIFYNTKIRLNYRLEYRTAYEVHKKCCDDYVLNEYEQCVPVCDPPCEHGACASPNECICHFFYIKVENSKHVCEPVCSTCNHGKCIKPYVCQCDPGYRLDLAHDDCVPTCDTNCEELHAHCTGPNECTCNDGYFHNVEKKTCEPICNTTCVHAVCTAPNECTCEPGYQEHPLNPFRCEPRCEVGCLNGACVGPDLCACDPGYEPHSEFICQPICSEPCIKGLCIAPDTCLCEVGYGLTEGSKFRCEPICDKACVNGDCTSPSQCTCHDGYYFDGDETMKHVCQPFCINCGGPFQECTGPNVCTCMDGYEMDLHGNVCVPSCPGGCKNGFCTAPGVCDCEPGHAPANESHCAPVCNPPCVHGDCSRPYDCDCHAGYEHSAKPHVCVPSCQIPCGNGTCYAPNHCTCDEGYQLSVQSAVACTPICDDPCKFGTCVAPNTCSCDKGYELKDGLGCVPKCDQPCGNNAVCVAPNTCRCKDGHRYVENPAEFTCVPVCAFDCANGTCEAPNLCTCDTGFEKDNDERCIPVCRTCSNGTCVAPDVCECADGYKLVERDAKQACEADCGNCDNGTCLWPGECRCDVGFVRKDNETGCVSACENNCNDRGLCFTENATCECFYGWNGISCDLPTFCLVHVPRDNEHLNATIVATYVNDTIGSVFSSSPSCNHNCWDNISNETLCFYNANGTDNDTIACLMSTDSPCSISEQRTKLPNYVTMLGILGTVVVAVAAIAVAVLLIRKHRSGSLSIGDIPQSSLRSRSSLLPEEDNNL